MQSERAQVQHVQSEKRCEKVLNINFLALIYQKHVKSDQISTLHLTSEMVKRDGPSVVRQVSFTLLLNLIVAIVILLSTRGTAGSDIWHMHLVGRPVVRSYHPRDYA